MKTVRVFLLLNFLSVSFFQVSAAAEVLVATSSSRADNNNFHIWEINRATINAQKIVIRNYLKRNATHRIMVRTALVTALAAGVGYYYYYHYRTPMPLPVGVKIPVDQNTLVNVRDGVQNISKNQIETNQRVLALEKAFELGVADKFKIPADQVSKGVAAAVAQAGKDAVKGTYNIVLQLGQYFYAGIPQAMAAGLVAHLIFRDLPTVLSLGQYYIVRPIRKINHPHSLEWFLMTQVKIERVRYRIDSERPYPGEHDENVGYHINYDKFFNNIARTASVLPLASDEFEQAHYKSSLVNDLNLLMRQIARIVAFCEIRIESVSAHNKTCGKHLKEETAYVLRSAEKLGKDVALLLASKEMHIKIPSAIEDFKLKMAEQLESFSLYEKAAYLDFTPAE